MSVKQYHHQSIHEYGSVLNKSEDGEVVFYSDYEKLKNALKSIANLWPIETTARIGEDSVHGINDGKSRAILAEAAVVIARKALGITKMP